MPKVKKVTSILVSTGEFPREYRLGDSKFTYTPYPCSEKLDDNEPIITEISYIPSQVNPSWRISFSDDSWKEINSDFAIEWNIEG